MKRRPGVQPGCCLPSEGLMGERKPVCSGCSNRAGTGAQDWLAWNHSFATYYLYKPGKSLDLSEPQFPHL